MTAIPLNRPESKKQIDFVSYTEHRALFYQLHWPPRRENRSAHWRGLQLLRWWRCAQNHRPADCAETPCSANVHEHDV